MTGVRLVAAVLALVGCAAIAPIHGADELAGEWHGRVSGPAGHARAVLVVGPTGAYQATMYLDGGDRAFHGALMVVRPGQVRYQGSDGNGTVRVTDENGRRRLGFLRDDGGLEAVFERR